MKGDELTEGSIGRAIFDAGAIGRLAVDRPREFAEGDAHLGQRCAAGIHHDG
jgi:hypothetical protein